MCLYVHACVCVRVRACDCACIHAHIQYLVTQLYRKKYVCEEFAYINVIWIERLIKKAFVLMMDHEGY